MQVGFKPNNSTYKPSFSAFSNVGLQDTLQILQDCGGQVIGEMVRGKPASPYDISEAALTQAREGCVGALQATCPDEVAVVPSEELTRDLLATRCYRMSVDSVHFNPHERGFLVTVANNINSLDI